MKSQKPSLDAWKTLQSDTLLDTPIYSIRRELMENPDLDKPVAFHVVQSFDCVNVVAIDGDNPRDPDANLLMVEQYRVGTHRVGLETPGGFREESDTEPVMGAKRELLEETGARASDWISLGSIEANPAFMRHRMHVFLALNAKIDPDQKLGDGMEVLAPAWIKLRDFPKLVREGRIQHGMVLTSWALLQTYLSTVP